MMTTKTLEKTLTLMKKFLVVTATFMFLTTGCATIQQGPTIPEIPEEFQEEEYPDETPGWDYRNAC